MRTKYRQPSSQYVFGYQKFILMPEDYKATKSGKVNVKLPEVVGKGYGTFWRWKGRYRAVKGSRASKKSKTTALWYITNMMKYHFYLFRIHEKVPMNYYIQSLLRQSNIYVGK